MQLKNLALTKEEMMPEVRAEGSFYGGNGQQYPYGLTLDLNDDTLEKLGVKKLPAVGEVVIIQAKAKVVRVSEYADQDGDEPNGTDKCMGLQITDMDLELGGSST